MITLSSSKEYYNYVVPYRVDGMGLLILESSSDLEYYMISVNIIDGKVYLQYDTAYNSGDPTTIAFIESISLLDDKKIEHYLNYLESVKLFL